jgi:hypothetical protein
VSALELRAESEADDYASGIRVTTGSPTPIEVAAVTAVVATALEHLAEEDRRRELPAPSAWERSRRGVRRRLVRGDWRRFGL